MISDTHIPEFMDSRDPSTPRLQTILFLCQLILFTWISTDPVALAQPGHPNVLMIVVDDMNDWVGCLGNYPGIKTPNIDRLAARGLLFTNAHCPAPVCNPSRVATLTGLRPSTTGIYDNSIVWHEALSNPTTLPMYFLSHGYHVVGGGKVNHHTPTFNRKSDWNQYFDQIFDSHYQDQLARGLDVSNYQWPPNFPLNGLSSVRSLSKPPKNPSEFDWGAWDKNDAEMGDGRMVEWAVQFLKERPNKPFFLAAGIYRPHLPFYAPRKYFEMYPREEIQLPLLKENDLDDLPEAGKRMAKDRSEDFTLVVREGKYRDLVQAYLASVSYADALIGRLLDALDESDNARNTIIILWSDHGWHFGEKQHLHKFTLWERSTHIPWIIAAPGVTTPKTRSDRPVGLIDLFPTLNELCNLPSLPHLEGVSVVPLLKDPSLAWSRPALTTHGRANHALRTERWRYIRYADGSEELYDHQNDSLEWNNLANSPKFRAIKEELSKYLPTENALALKGSKKTKGRQIE